MYVGIKCPHILKTDIFFLGTKFVADLPYLLRQKTHLVINRDKSEEVRQFRGGKCKKNTFYMGRGVYH